MKKLFFNIFMAAWVAMFGFTVVGCGGPGDVVEETAEDDEALDDMTDEDMAMEEEATQ